MNLIDALLSRLVIEALPVPVDKQKHAWAGFLLGFAAFGAAWAAHSPRPLLWAAGVAFLVGLGKEIYDTRQSGGRFDPADLFATLLGGVFGGCVLALFLR